MLMNGTTSSAATAATSHIKRQRVDATLLLLSEDRRLRPEKRILSKLLYTAGRTLIRSQNTTQRKNRPTLYTRYRGSEFPLKDENDRELKKWRRLSVWMKAQVAALCLAEGRFVQIRMHLHDELRMDVDDERMKVYIRDRLARCLRNTFSEVPWFYFVIEDRASQGISHVRPHVHGAIKIPRVPVPVLRDGRPTARFRRLIKKEGIAEAEYFAGRMLIGKALRQSTGNDGRRDGVVNGLNQLNNVWKRKPYRALFNDEWVSYALKNMNQVSPSLPDNRLSMSLGLNQEAQRLWDLIRRGEDALGAWA